MKYNSVFFSIIIPVYNTKDYLEDCIRSIIKQDQENYEIILIDDGSNDGSEYICDTYKKKYNMIKVIHKKNGGPAQARNLGIKEAEGKYIIFLDSDDMLENNCLSNLFKLIKEYDADVYLGQMFKIQFPKGKIEDRINKICFKERKKDILKNILKYSTISITYIWRNVYKTEFIKNNELFFQENFFCGEDIDWNTEVFLKAKKIETIDFYTHRYRGNRKGSIVTECSFRRVYDFYLVVEKWMKKANYINDIELKQILKEFYASGFYKNLKFIYNFKNFDRDNIISSIENGEFWNYAKDKKDKKIKKMKMKYGLNMTLKYLNVKYRAFTVLKRLLIRLCVIDR